MVNPEKGQGHQTRLKHSSRKKNWDDLIQNCCKGLGLLIENGRSSTESHKNDCAIQFRPNTDDALLIQREKGGDRIDEHVHQPIGQLKSQSRLRIHEGECLFQGA